MLASHWLAHRPNARAASAGQTNRERAYLLAGRRIDVGKWKALSFGYSSFGKQRKVTRAPQAIGSLAGDSSLLFQVFGWSVKTWMFGFAEVKREPPVAGMTRNSKINLDCSFRWNDGGV